MLILHTSDWHLGRKLRGESRHEEHTRVLAEIVSIADRRAADAVIVAGDLFDSVAPAPKSQRLLWRTVMDLRDTGAAVVLIAGNHDHPGALESLRPLTEPLGVTSVGLVRAPTDGGVVTVTGRSGETAQIGLLPFLSQRHVVRARDLMTSEAHEAAGTYAERYRQIVAALSQEMDPTAVNVFVAHGFVRGGLTGGGERDAHTIEDYWIDSTFFGPTASYVALGHLHRCQSIPGPSPTWYSGSPIQVDFGEGGDTKAVLLVECQPSRPARVEPVELTTPDRLLTVEGDLDELAALGPTVGDAWLRVRVRAPGSANLAAEVRALLPGAIDIRVEPTAEIPGRSGVVSRSGRPAGELFADYCRSEGIDDSAVADLFSELYDEAVSERA